MKNFNEKLLRIDNEEGLTLIEVLISVVFLALIVTTFLIVFIQSTTMNTTSETIIDATYIAQSEMEKIYSKSKQTPYDPDEIEQAMLSLGYHLSGGTYIQEHVYHPNYKVEVTYQEPVDFPESMNQVLVKVFEDGQLKAQMENVLLWEGE